MAGGSAKKLVKENESRIHLLRTALLFSQIMHLLAMVITAHTVIPAEIHDTRSWVFLGAINIFAGFAVSFLSNLAKGGTSLTPETVRGAKSKSGGASCPWWIENLQDLIFLISGTNVLTVFSMKMGVALLGLIPLYVVYLILTTLKGYLFSPGAPKPVEDPAPQAASLKKGGKKRQTVSKNKTR